MINTNPITGKVEYVYKAVACAQDPSVQLTQLSWLGNLSSLLSAVEDCFVTNTDGFYPENMRAWNTSAGSMNDESAPYPERGPHKLPSVCSLTWRDGGWEMHLLIRDFLEVIAGLFADGRLNATRQQDTFTPESGIANDFEVYLAGDFTVQRHSSELNSKGYRYYYELSYTPATMSSIRMFALVEQEDLGNVRGALERYGIHIKWEE